MCHLHPKGYFTAKHTTGCIQRAKLVMLITKLTIIIQYFNFRFYSHNYGVICKNFIAIIKIFLLLFEGKNRIRFGDK